MGRYELHQRKKPIGTIVLLLVFLAITTAGAWLYWRSTQSIETGEVDLKAIELPVPKVKKLDQMPESGLVTVNDSSRESEQVDIETTDPEPLPSLKESDAFIDGHLSNFAPELAGWMKTDNLIRKVVLIINDFSQGQRLSKHLRWLVLNEPFKVAEDPQGLHISPKSYRRYDALAEAIDSANVQDILSLYRKVRPLCEDIFAEFGYPDDYRLEDLIQKAAAEILSAPVIESRIALVKPTVLYKFADNQLESLNPVQKQMLRMGPQNTRIIQNKLRLLIEALVNMSEANHSMHD